MSDKTMDTISRLSARRLRVAGLLTALMMIAYFGFVLLVAFDKPLMGTLLAGGGISVGVVLGAIVILLAPTLTGIYVYWANNTYDPALERLRNKESGR